MPHKTLGNYLELLESRGLLHRVKCQVDPVLEIAAITDRISKANGSALFFENVKGSAYPVLTNALGSFERIQLALGRDDMEAVGIELASFLNPKAISSMDEAAKSIRLLKGLLSFPPRHVGNGSVQQVVDMEPDMLDIPSLKCWPKDGGRFLTLPLVITKDPQTGQRNVGVYRMQIYGSRTAGIHWHVHKHGAAHFRRAEQMGVPLEVAVVLGCDPSIAFSAICPLPEGFDEFMFAGFLRGRGIRLTRCKTVDLDVPADSEFVLEGVVNPGERKIEGPFGDHLGHYSLEEPFPVFHLKALTRRKKPVYWASVVGRPPMEDGHIGKAIEKIFTPLIRFNLPELTALNMPLETGFHNLVIASFNPSHPGHAKKVMCGLWGMGMMSLAKCIITVRPDVDTNNPRAALEAVLSRTDLNQDMVIMQDAPVDTLDVSSPVLNLGSKLGLDATGPELKPLEAVETSAILEKFTSIENNITPSEKNTTSSEKNITPSEKNTTSSEKNITPCEKNTTSSEKNITPSEKNITPSEKSITLREKNNPTITEGSSPIKGLLVVSINKKSPSQGRELIRSLWELEETKGVRAIVVLDDDVNIADNSQLLWAIFNRFDPARDLMIENAVPVDGRPLMKFGWRFGIDATSKSPEEGYMRKWPGTIEINEDTAKLVDSRWSEYGF